MSGSLFLAFGHSSRVGKNAAADAAEKAIVGSGGTVERRSFAEPLKRIAFLLFESYGLKPGAHYEANPDERTVPLETLGLTPVGIWVQVGNRLREVYADIWADAALRPSTADAVIISDLRFPNEAARIRELGGFLVKVERPGYAAPVNGSDRMIPADFRWDRVLLNDGTLGELESRAAGIAQELALGRWL